MGKHGDRSPKDARLCFISRSATDKNRDTEPKKADSKGGKPHRCTARCTKSSGASESQTDVDLIREAWPHLPGHVKAAILALVKTA